MPGHRPTLLLLHDSLGCVELWREVPERLARATGLRVLAYDRLGFGRSDPHPGPLAPDFIAEEAEATIPLLRDRLGLGDLIPLGHSVGGAMAVATAARHPDLCRAVVTVSAQAFVEDRTTAGIRAEAEAFRDPARFARLARHHGAKARWALDAWTGTWLSPAFAGWTQDEALRRLRCPLLALHGDRDEYGSPAHPRRLAALTPAPAEVVLLDGCGHLPHREQPARLVAEVARFLSAHAIAGDP
ncbi:hydrolase-related protein [Rubellimicrobium mesophilum DSM 19309]|uniref:Hydrolase-related protein n=1 Tax=Rubellimicrobium mesophilum DSM 19309 TaxID=442562 RepID=A0A017HR92_9RHOB|nr:hydrolase-related protein [Rubellimicrobium mesophilum DSM 19309]